MDIQSTDLPAPEAFLIDEGHGHVGTLRGLPVVQNIEAFRGHRFVVAIARPHARRSVTERLTALGLVPRSIVASAADRTVELGEGIILSRNVILDSFCSIGRGTFLRNGCFVGHDARIGDFCYVAPRASLGGNSSIGAGSFVGMGAVVRPGIRIGSECLIGAGARVNEDLADRTVVRSDGRMLQMRNPMRLLRDENAGS